MFATMVRAFRRRAGWTQEDLATAAGMNVRTIGNLETGRVTSPRPVTVRLLADALGLRGDERDRFCEAAAPALAPSPATLDRTPTPPRPDAAPSVPASPAEHVVPRQLPAVTRDFVGRTAELADLHGLEASPVVVITGAAGVGKTALAVHWGHQVADRFPDGHLYINLRGFRPVGAPVEPAEAIRQFLYALSVPPGRIPVTLEEQAALYRSLTFQRRLLVILDNARDADQVRPLLPGSPTCQVVVTSRHTMAGLIAVDDAHPLPLYPLPPVDAKRLLCRRLYRGGARKAGAEASIDELVRWCSGLPLALVVIAGRAADPNLTLTALARNLRDPGTRLDAMGGEDVAANLRTVFWCSYRILSADAARLFRLLGLHPGPEVSIAAAASLAGVSPPLAQRQLTELADAQLTTEHSPGRYAMHDLLHAYAAAQTHATETADERHLATRRMLDHYLHTAHSGARQLDPLREPIDLIPCARATTTVQLTEHQQALDWFSTDYTVLLTLIPHASALGQHAHAWQLAWTTATFHHRQGRWSDLSVPYAAVAAADRLEDPAAQAHARRLLGLNLLRLGRNEEALANLKHALDLSLRTNDRSGQARAHGVLAGVWEHLGRHADAIEHAHQALDLYRATGHRRGQAASLNAIGWNETLLGDHRAALDHCRQAMTMLQEMSDPAGLAATWDSLGHIHRQLGEPGQAIECYQRSVELFRQLADRYHQADALLRLGDVQQLAGNPQAADTAWHDAIALLDASAGAIVDRLRASLRDRIAAYKPTDPRRPSHATTSPAPAASSGR